MIQKRTCAWILGLCLVISPAWAQTPWVEAHWIGPPEKVADSSTRLFRKSFELKAVPAKAVLRIVGLGDYDPLLNGERLAPTGMNQPWSQYEKTLYYRDFDVSFRLRSGENCLAITLGNSFWNNPNPPVGRYNKGGPQRHAEEPLLLCAEMIVEDQAGQITRIATDQSWKTHTGPVVFSHVYAGEDFDARMRVPGWDRPGFEDSDWMPARIVPPPASALKVQTWPGISGLDVWAPLSVKETDPGVFLYSFPQNASAQISLDLKAGHPGDKVSFRCGEHKNAQDKLFGGYVVDCNLITDGGALSNRWTFFYLGMQFVQMSGAVPEGVPNPDGKPVLSRMQLIHVRSALSQAGEFSSSSDLYNRTHQLIDWAMRSNASHVLTDCPHREKLGWLECAYLLEPSFLYRYDAAPWFAKICRDIQDAQEPDGRVLTVAPSYPAHRFPGAFDFTVEWGAAAVLAPWHLYEWTGDPAVLRDNFECMKRYTDFLTSKAVDGVAQAGLGDWYDYGHGQPPGPSRFTPVELSATATWGLCALTVSRAAEALGNKREARAYRELHRKIAEGFQRHFMDPQTQTLKNNGSPQTGNAMALCANIAPEEIRPRLVDGIVADLEQRGWQQTPGDVGHVFFIRALAEAGRSDVLHRVYSRESSGSYGGILAKGLTSLPETWDAMMDGSQSLNHCMLGHVMEWFYGYVLGIRQTPGSVGWQRALIAPCPGSLSSAEGSVQTPQGRIGVAWRQENRIFRMEVDMPENIQAEAILPSGKRVHLSTGRQVLEEEL